MSDERSIQVPNYNDAVDQLSAQFARLGELSNFPEKLVIPLDHPYSIASLSFAQLKGRDRALALVISQAVQGSDCSYALAIANQWEYGMAQHTRGYGRWGNGGFEVVEELDSMSSLTEWRRPEGVRLPATSSEVRFGGDELVPPGAIDLTKNAEPEFSEATGNEGATYERHYRRATLVVWRSNVIIRLLARSGFQPAMSTLTSFVETSEKGPEDSGKATREPRAPARELAREMLDAWDGYDERGGVFRYYKHNRVDRGGFLKALIVLGDLDLFSEYLCGPFIHAPFTGEDNQRLVSCAAELIGFDDWHGYTTLIRAHANRSLAATAKLVSQLAQVEVASEFADRAEELLADYCRTLIRALEAEVSSLKESNIGRRTLEAQGFVFGFRTLPMTVVRAVLEVVIRVGNDSLLRRLGAVILDAGDTVPWDESLGVAVITLLDHMDRRLLADRIPLPLLIELFDRLEDRLGQPLEEPTDMIRRGSIRCGCDYCSEVSEFLRNPAEKILVLAARKDIRRHVQSEAKQVKSDLTFQVENTGRPHKLVCTKTDESFRKLCKQRARDERWLKKLNGIFGE